MPSSKRERQRENRQSRRAVEEKEAHRQRLMRRIRTGAIWAVVIVGVLFLANMVWGGGGDETAAGLFLI